jgi:hypothetical protein
MLFIYKASKLLLYFKINWKLWIVDSNSTNHIMLIKNNSNNADESLYKKASEFIYIILKLENV